MFQRTILSALAVTAGIAAGIAVRVLTDRKYENKPENEEDDDEIHFIRISDPDEEKEEEEEFSGEVKEICAVYPYLKPSFVKKTLDSNKELNTEYEEDTLLKIVHRSAFNDPDALGSYVEIMETGGYECSAEGNTILASKKFFTENGAVVSDILNVANQTNALKGEYCGYDLNRA